METKLIIPILNRRTTLFKAPIWYLSPEVSIKVITPEDYGLIYDYIPEEFKPFVSTKCKCVIIEKVDPNTAGKIALSEGSKIAFLLNYFKQSYPVAISFAVQIIKIRKTRVDKFIDLPVIADVRLQRGHDYRIRTGIDGGTISDFYKVISTAHTNYPNILLSLDRFNSALHRSQLLDKIIDISVCLESLIDGTTEIKNRFSLYNSWIAELDENKRLDCFKLLGSLYDARSAVVHGLSMSEKEYRKKIDPISDKWENVVRIAEKALGYYLLYVYQNGVDKWYQHQRGLVLGIEQRIV